MATTTTQAEHGARGPFRNEAVLDFTKEENERAMREAIGQVRKELGLEYTLVEPVIGGGGRGSVVPSGGYFAEATAGV